MLDIRPASVSKWTEVKEQSFTILSSTIDQIDLLLNWPHIRKHCAIFCLCHSGPRCSASLFIVSITASCTSGGSSLKTISSSFPLSSYPEMQTGTPLTVCSFLVFHLLPNGIEIRPSFSDSVDGSDSSAACRVLRREEAGVEPLAGAYVSLWRVVAVELAAFLALGRFVVWCWPEGGAGRFKLPADCNELVCAASQRMTAKLTGKMSPAVSEGCSVVSRKSVTGDRSGEISRSHCFQAAVKMMDSSEVHSERLRPAVVIWRMSVWNWNARADLQILEARCPHQETPNCQRVAGAGRS